MYMEIPRRQTIAPPAGVLLNDGPAEGDISQNALQQIIGEHHRYLARQHGTRAKLHAAKLDGLKMAGRDLSEADLSGASLVGADLRGANLTNASLYCADLRGCNLSHTRLMHADLRGASFKGADLSFAVLDHADLRAATMLYQGDTLKFQGNAHDESPFGAVDFSNASLRHASFRNAKLDNANFTDALLQGASFRGARLRNACFRSAVLTGVHLGELDVPAKSFRHALIAPTADAQTRAKMIYGELVGHHEWFVSEGKRGRPAVIDYEDLRPLGDALKGLCLAGLSARNTIAIGVDFSGCRLQAARFDGADLRAAGFTNADLSGTSFKRAKLAHASFCNARIRDLILCTGQVMYFSAGSREDLSKQFGGARIEPSTAIAALSEQQGSC